MKKPKFSFVLDAYESHRLKDGSYPILLVVRKANKRKTISLKVSASYIETRKRDGTTEIISQWNDTYQRYEVDGRKKNLHPDRVKLNEWLDEVSTRCNKIIQKFADENTDWTLTQFEKEFLNKSEHFSVEDYFNEFIDKLRNAGNIGNMNAYQRTLDMLKLFDPRFGRLMFADIDLKYVNKFHEYLDINRGCEPVTIKYYIKTLRSLMNKAIKDGQASETTYPFGKYGYSIAALNRETDKRYLPSDYIDKIKNADLESKALGWARNLFLFSYYCQGMAFVDMAHLTRRNILVFEGGKYIAYRRRKTEGKNSKPISIKITDKIQELLDWFAVNTKLMNDFLTPIISKPYEGEQLYNHVRDRNRKFNKHLKTLANELKFEGINLSSYVSRHSYAMRLKNSGIPEDVISEALGHKDLATTKIYLDSFQNDVVAKANEVL